MILRPEQIKLLRLGRPVIPANGDGGDSSSQSNTTSNNITNTLTQDRRLVVDNGGIGISTDNSNVTLSMTDHGAINQAVGLGIQAIQSMQANSSDALDASVRLNKTGYDMLKLNTDLAAHLSGDNSAIVNSAMAQSQAAMQTVASVVSKPLDMNDPKHILVAAGICAVAVVAVASFSKGK
ncbi:hypothetical protein [Herbaspirillum huttiense]|uniref:hypothetical protein n=1 Tax=Herbaspirillum huttiense TaxID=863372 RepID=UPI0031E09705